MPNRTTKDSFVRSLNINIRLNAAFVSLMLISSAILLNYYFQRKEAKAKAVLLIGVTEYNSKLNSISSLSLADFDSSLLNKKIKKNTYSIGLESPSRAKRKESLAILAKYPGIKTPLLNDSKTIKKYDEVISKFVSASKDAGLEDKNAYLFYFSGHGHAVPSDIGSEYKKERILLEYKKQDKDISETAFLREKSEMTTYYAELKKEYLITDKSKQILPDKNKNLFANLSACETEIDNTRNQFKENIPSTNVKESPNILALIGAVATILGLFLAVYNSWLARKKDRREEMNVSLTSSLGIINTHFAHKKDAREESAFIQLKSNNIVDINKNDSSNEGIILRPTNQQVRDYGGRQESKENKIP